MGDQPELAYWIALRRAGLGSISFARLLARFTTIGEAWTAPVGELTAAGLDARYAAAVQRARERFDGERELHLLEKSGAAPSPGSTPIIRRYCRRLRTAHRCCLCVAPQTRVAVSR